MQNSCKIHFRVRFHWSWYVMNTISNRKWGFRQGFHASFLPPLPRCSQPHLCLSKRALRTSCLFFSLIWPASIISSTIALMICGKSLSSKSNRIVPEMRENHAFRKKRFHFATACLILAKHFSIQLTLSICMLKWAFLKTQLNRLKSPYVLRATDGLVVRC